MHNKLSKIQAASKKQRSIMDNIVIVSAIIEENRERNTYILSRCSQVF